MSRLGFLSSVLPATGVYCLVALKKEGRPKQTFVNSIEEVVEQAEGIVTSGYDAYFALATFADSKEGRTSINAVELRAFFLDIDCGVGKPYPTQADGILAVKAFIKAVELPKPTLVNSGRGVHVYWGLDKPLPREEWKPLAEGLKALCVQYGLEADPVVTADTARILRIPDTLNFKGEESLPVTVIYTGASNSVEVFRPIFNSANVLTPTKNFIRQLDPTTLALMGNYQSRFKTIMVKSAAGTGCNQLLQVFKEQETVSEPLWRGALSIAFRCVDGETAIHKISKKHPEYNPAVTIEKAQKTLGPYTCESFRKTNPSGCEGCTQKITSPIQIGREVIEPPAGEEVVVEHIEPITEQPISYVIPKYPFPFFRGKVGGVFRKGDPNKEGDQDELVSLYDFYVVRRISDVEDGDSVWLRLHLPKDGVREFTVLNRDIIAKDKFASKLAEKGILVEGKRLANYMGYIMRWIEELQATTKADISRKQFGWLADNSAFVIGDREIQADKVVYSPPTDATLPIIPLFTAKGDFHIWKDVINTYGRPGMEGRAFAFFMGFGGPLMKFVADGALSGFLLNLISKWGGTGKSTMLEAINSIYGIPKPLLLSSKDTHNHRLQRMGAMQSMTVVIDEITTLAPEQMSNLVYDITSGQGKNRMSGKANVERVNKTVWQIPVVSTSNRAIIDALLSIKAFPEPELLRLLEIEMPADPHNDPVWSKAHFGRMQHNYGHAIDPYIKYIMGNLPEVIKFVNEVNIKLDRAGELKNTERFWSAGVTIGLAGGLLASKLNLHNIPTEPIFDFAVKLIKSSRIRNQAAMFDSEDTIGGFMQRRLFEVLVINGGIDKRTGLETGPILNPRGALTARYEPDTKMLFIVQRTYRDDCAKMLVGFEDSLAPYKKSGALVAIKKKRMTAGTITSADSGVMALWFDVNKLDAFREEVLLNASNSGATDTNTLG